MTWPAVRLDDVCEKITDGTHHSPANGSSGDFKYVTAKNIKPWGLDLTDITYVDAGTHREIYSRCDVRKNDVLYVKDGANTGRVALNTLDDEFSLLSSVGVFRPGKNIKPKYLVYALQAPAVLDRMLGDMAGVAIRRLTIRKLKESQIPLAPLEQQDEIVAEIEKQFSRLDEAVSNLQRVKSNLKHYKASVLKAAVEGRLVKNEGCLAPGEERAAETGAELIVRVLADRATSRGNGKTVPVEVDGVDSLHTLPAGWHWATLDQLGQEGRPVIYGIIKPGPDTPDGVPYVRVTEMKDGTVDFLNLRRASKLREEKFKRARLRAGDLLISKDGTIGRVALVPPELEGGNITQHVMRAPVHRFVDRQFVMWAIRSDFCQRWLTGETRGVALRGVNVEDFRRLPIPVPPLAEQRRLVGEIDRRLSIVREVESEVDANLKRAQALRQAVLSKAFSGA